MSVRVKACSYYDARAMHRVAKRRHASSALYEHQASTYVGRKIGRRATTFVLTGVLSQRPQASVAIRPTNQISSSYHVIYSVLYIGLLWRPRSLLKQFVALNACGTSRAQDKKTSGGPGRKYPVW